MLGGGGSRGAMQVGILLALMEAGVEPPRKIVGASVGALNGSVMAAFPSLGGAQMLRQVWLSDLTRDVFRPHPVSFVLGRLRRRLNVLPPSAVKRLVARITAMIGVTAFEDLKVPLAVIATDLAAGRRVVMRSGPLGPALLASTAIPGVYPAVTIDGRDYLDGGVVDNTPISIPVEEKAKDVLAIGLMAGAELEKPPATWTELLQRTLQLSLHYRLLSDFERLKSAARVVVICPVAPVSTDSVIAAGAAESLIERSRAAAARLLRESGTRLFRRSGIHYLNLDPAR